MPHYAKEWLQSVINSHDATLGRASGILHDIREELAITDEILAWWIKFEPKKWAKYKDICRLARDDSHYSTFVEYERKVFYPMYLEMMRSVLTAQ